MSEKLAGAVRGAGTLEIGLVGLALVVAAAAGLWLALRWLHRARLVEDVPTSRARSASQGYVELQGRCQMMPGAPVRAPLTLLPCAWWSYRIEQLQDSGRHRRWRTLERATSDALFLLVDDTGRCIVDPEGAEILSPPADVWRGSHRRPAPLLSGRPLPRTGGGGRYRYTERRLDLGIPLYAVGEFRTHGTPATWDAAEELRLLLAAWKRDRDSLIARFDANDDGEIDLQEWQQVRRAAQRELAREHREHVAAPGVNVLSRPADGRPFVLAALPQAKVSRAFRRRSLAAAAASMLAAGALLWLVATRFS